MSEKLVEMLLQNSRMRDDEGLNQGSDCGDMKRVEFPYSLEDSISKTLLDVGEEEKQRRG